MPSYRAGTVLEIEETSDGGVQRLSVAIGEEIRRAILYPRWAAPAKEGDRVIVNTTAVDLDLGTGGLDFVVWNDAVEHYDAPSGGHIMKLRYTPAQCDVLAVEAPESPHHDVMAGADTLGDRPVVATSLHSQLVPVLCGIRDRAPDARVVYVMTDGAALEAGFSNTIAATRDAGWITGVVTAGHAVGGDLESVTLHSGLLAAAHVLRADVIVAGIGPGVVGTATRFGTTAVDLGTIALASQSLEGRSVVCLRISEADARPRHRGLSHHVIAALGWVDRAVDRVRTCVVAPSGWTDAVKSALPAWPVQEAPGADVHRALADASEKGIGVTHMGRTHSDDPVFFEAAYAAGSYAATLIKE